MSKRKGRPRMWYAPERVEWLLDRDVLRTTLPVIPIVAKFLVNRKLRKNSKVSNIAK
jgi:hypothetical protein